MGWKQANPVFPVTDVVASIDWYRRILQFEPRVVNPPDDQIPVYAVLSRDSVSIHLLRSEEAPHGLAAPVQAQFWIENGLDELFNRVRDLGVKIIQEPGDRLWNHRDFMVADPDGNIIWISVPLSRESDRCTANRALRLPVAQQATTEAGNTGA